MSKRLLVAATSIAALLAAAQAAPAYAQDSGADAGVTIVKPDGTAVQSDGAAETMTEAVETPSEAAPGATTETADLPPAEGTPVEGQIFRQSPDSFLASTLLDADVVSAEGDTIGDVVDLVLTSDGTIEGIVVGVGGFLGLGKKSVALQFETIETRQDEDLAMVFVLNATREQLEEAPAFKTQREVQREAEAQAALEAARQQPVGGIAPPLPGDVPPASN